MNQPTVYTILHIQKLRRSSWIHGACFSAPRLATFAGTTEPLVSQRLNGIDAWSWGMSKRPSGKRFDGKSPS